MHFALSTHLFHNERPARAHVEAAAAQGFTELEIFATTSHVDSHDGTIDLGRAVGVRTRLQGILDGLSEPFSLT